MTIAQDSPVSLNASVYADCGFSVFPLQMNSKRPAVPAWQHTPYEFSDDVQAKLAGRTGFGVVLTARDLVIDVDPRNFKPGDKPHVRLFKDAGIDTKTIAVIARTGSGGLHLYFRLPAGVAVRKKITDYPGIDFLSVGAYVVGVGSVHPDTQKLYAWAGERTLADREECPEALLRLFSRIGTPTTSDGFVQQGHEAVSDADEIICRTFIEYLKTAPPAIQGQNGDAQTFSVACKGKDLGLSPGKTIELMLEHYNPRCIPDWRADQMEYKVRNAYAYSQNPAGNGLAIADFKPVAVKDNSLFRGYDVTAKGEMKKTLNNVMNFFVDENAPFEKLVAWDMFNGQVKMMRPAPWTTEPVPADGLEWSDNDSKQLRWWLGRVKQADFPTELIDQAVENASKLWIVHPVRDYLNGLVWDKVPRLSRWLIDHAGAKDDKYVEAVSEKAILQAVKRIYDPGCKADYVLILEGIQGIGKSTLIEILGGKWYADIVIDPHARDTADAMRGKWFVEFSEMEVTRRADANALKAFITRKTDRFRLAYGRRATDLPRQCVFVGTINPDATNEYLADSTGNRRFWPVWIKQVDFSGLSEVRDQIFAEAVGLVKGGAASHIMDREIIEIAKVEQRGRQTSDPWIEAVREWVHDQKIDFATTKDVWVYALRGRESELSLAHQKRIAASLKDLGWEPKFKWRDGKTQRGYQKPGEDILS